MDYSHTVKVGECLENAFAYTDDLKYDKSYEE